MLVLTRKPNQKILIGENITISIVRVTGNTIRLGIDAPKDVRIIRSELEQKDSEKTGSQSAGNETAIELPVREEPKKQSACTSLNCRSQRKGLV